MPRGLGLRKFRVFFRRTIQKAFVMLEQSYGPIMCRQHNRERQGKATGIGRKRAPWVKQSNIQAGKLEAKTEPDQGFRGLGLGLCIGFFGLRWVKGGFIQKAGWSWRS